MAELVLRTQGLTRKFGDLVAVDRLELEVGQGSVYGFLGPNGAGKTTTIRMLLGLIRPHAGRVWLFGLPLAKQRLVALGRVGSLVEAPSLYPHLTGWENLEVIRRMTGGARAHIQHALSIVRMEADARRLVRHYSQGMRQRLGLAAAFLGRPELLILDEPTNGLDPAGIHEMRQLISQLPQQEGVTVFLSSHLLGEVEQMATHVGIIHQGRLIFQGTPEQLRARYQGQLNLSTGCLDETRRLLIQAGRQVRDAGNHHLTVPVKDLADVAGINALLVQAGHPVHQLVLAQPSLEDIFLILTDSAKED